MLRVKSITPLELRVGVAFGLSRLAPALKERTLGSLQLGGPRTVKPYVDVESESVTFQVPGLILHANETVRHFEQYDYVFAPLLNYYVPEPAEPPVPKVVNWWAFWQPGLFGTAALGTFTYRIPFAVPGQAQPISTTEVEMCPLPKLSYVYRQVFQELGLPVLQDCFAGELGQLVMLTGNLVGNPFRLADLMPNLTVVEFLQRIRRTLGIVPAVSAFGQVRVVLLQQLLASTEYEDWSHLAAATYTERELPDVVGQTLTYHVAAEDKIAESFFQQPDALPTAPAVATVADLPTPTLGADNAVPTAEVRLVESEQSYYKSTVTLTLEQGLVVTWARNGSVFDPVPVAGGGEEVEQGITATAMQQMPALYASTYREDSLLPAFTQAPYTPGRPNEERGEELRLGFYRGRQPYGIDEDHPLAAQQPSYPLVTPFACNILGESVGDLSLQLHGEQGTYQQLLNSWLDVLLYQTPVKRTIYLTAEHLAGFRPEVKKRIDGNLYLVKSIAVELPLVKGAMVTLIPLPRG